MSANIVISGDISLDDIRSALTEHFKGSRKVHVLEAGKDTSDYNKTSESKEDIEKSLFISDTSFNDLKAKLATKTKELSKMEVSSSKALASVQTFHTQQKQLFDEFVLLRQRYDEQKLLLLDTLWDKCTANSPELSEIPKVEDAETFIENEDHVGIYNLGEVLGEGQFALVRSCTVSHSRGDRTKQDFHAEYAMKILTKEKLLSFHSLKRVSNEVKILRTLVNDYIVKIRDVIQTKKKLYIITEKGGCDLFEFFDEHPEGVPESWAREIVSCVFKGVLYCHENKICHRDLKPENILVRFDTETGTCNSVKLCDFGLAHEFERDKPLQDFCGSPGFFAPEMIIHGSYFGDKVDIWSCGCILLELVLGHERFCEHWMAPYDYEVMQDKMGFSTEIKETLEKLPAILDALFSEQLSSFILQFLHLRSSVRPTMMQILAHPWIGLSDDEKLELGILTSSRPSKKMSIDVADSNRSASPGSDDGADLVRSLSAAAVNPSDHDVDPELIKKMYYNQSARERKHFEDFNHDRTDHDKVHLPPIEPQTPNVVQARKILLKGADLAHKLTSQSSQSSLSSMGSPASSPTPSHKWSHDNQTPTVSPHKDLSKLMNSPFGSASAPDLHSPMPYSKSAGNGNDSTLSLKNPDSVSAPVGSPFPTGLSNKGSQLSLREQPLERIGEEPSETKFDSIDPPPEYSP